jgi:hypothetical protein
MNLCNLRIISSVVAPLRYVICGLSLLSMRPGVDMSFNGFLAGVLKVGFGNGPLFPVLFDSRN